MSSSTIISVVLLQLNCRIGMLPVTMGES